MGSAALHKDPLRSHMRSAFHLTGEKSEALRAATDPNTQGGTLTQPALPGCGSYTFPVSTSQVWMVHAEYGSQILGAGNLKPRKPY